MATVNSTLPRNIEAVDRTTETRDVVQALDALEALTLGHDLPTRDELGSLFRVMREALELRIRAVERALGEG